uniref:Uncharacterized protein n=1 Tax=Oryza rufipogon TaxID=4529 RepID=A0A0E0R3A0_ORYRU
MPLAAPLAVAGAVYDDIVGAYRGFMPSRTRAFLVIHRGPLEPHVRCPYCGAHLPMGDSGKATLPGGGTSVPGVDVTGGEKVAGGGAGLPGGGAVVPGGACGSGPMRRRDGRRGGGRQRSVGPRRRRSTNLCGDHANAQQAAH